jgi:hypothetical protein
MQSICLHLASIRVKVWFLIVLNSSLALFFAGAGLLGNQPAFWPKELLRS